MYTNWQLQKLRRRPKFYTIGVQTKIEGNWETKFCRVWHSLPFTITSCPNYDPLMGHIPQIRNGDFNDSVA